MFLFRELKMKIDQKRKDKENYNVYKNYEESDGLVVSIIVPASEWRKRQIIKDYSFRNLNNEAKKIDLLLISEKGIFAINLIKDTFLEKDDILKKHDSFCEVVKELNAVVNAKTKYKYGVERLSICINNNLPFSYKGECINLREFDYFYKKYKAPNSHRILCGGIREYVETFLELDLPLFGDERFEYLELFSEMRKRPLLNYNKRKIKI